MKTPPSDLAARLLASSTDILRLDGAVRLDDVAETIGVPRATLYYYFSGRDDLTAYLLIRHLEEAAEVVASVSPNGGPDERLRSLLVEMVRFLAQRPGLCGGLLSAIGSGLGMEEVLLANDRVIALPLRNLLIEGLENGEFTFQDATDTANLMLGAILIAVLGRAVAERRPEDAAFHESLAGQLVRTVTTTE